jgi:hypothetical protein
MGKTTSILALSPLDPAKANSAIYPLAREPWNRRSEKVEF